MLVVDASVIAPFLVDHHSDGARIRTRLRGERLAGPDLLKVETQSVLRRRSLSGTLDGSAAARAVAELMALPITSYPAEPLLARAWELRCSVTTYDACYIALAEVLGVALLTGDERLARAHGTRCTIELA